MIVLPMGIESRAHSANEVLRVPFRQPNVPFQTVKERGVREVGRADEGGGQSTLSLKEPRLRMELGDARVVRDPYLGAQLYESVEGLGLESRSCRS